MSANNTLINWLQLSDDELWAKVQDWHKRGETAVELYQLVRYIFLQQKKIDTGFKVFDCAGTGGDGANTFNISTTAAIIASAAGIKITKNGGRSTTSKTGSVDVLEKLGLDFGLSDQARLAALAKHNLAFFSSKVTMEMLGRIKRLCREHKTTSFISLIGPLASPTKLEGQIIGVGQQRWLEPIKGTLAMLIKDGLLNRAIALHSKADNAALDELSTASDSKLYLLADSEIELEFKPEMLGIQRSSLQDLAGGDHETNAKIIRDILDGQEQGPKLATACLNAALLIVLSENKVKDQSSFLAELARAFEIAINTVAKGSARENFQELLQFR